MNSFIRVPLMAALLIGALLFTGCSVEKPAPSPADYNILVITIDTLRADHLGCYGYHRNTSPFIDSIAAAGVVFERAMSPSSFTCESVSALFTGLLPSESHVGAGWMAIPKDAPNNLGQSFARAGYSTGFMTCTPALADPAFDAGFGENDHIEKRWGISGQGKQLSKRVLDFVQKNAGQKTMVYAHYLDPHEPYDPAKESYLKFAKTIYPNPLRLHEDVCPFVPELVKSGFAPGEARFEDMVLRYDAEISETDEAIHELFDGLKSQGVLDHTLVVITADHGEEFLEHGYVEHAWRLYNECVHVPFLFWAPDLLKPQRVSDFVSTSNLLATLQEIGGIREPHREVPETFAKLPLFERTGATLAYAPSSKPVISELHMETRSSLRAVIQDGYMYFAAQRWLTPDECAQKAQVAVQETELALLKKGEFPLIDDWGPVVHEELFDLNVDPGEQHSVLEDQPDRAEKFRELLKGYKAYCGQGTSLGSARSAPPALTPEQADQMRALGYGGIK